MPFDIKQDQGRPVTIKDEGVTLVQGVASIDFTGSGVTSSAIGNDVTENITGGGGDPVDLTSDVTGVLPIANGGTNASTASDALTSLGAEAVANKSTSTSLGTSDTLYPSQNAVKTYVDTVVTGLLEFKGSTDASTNPNYPSALKGDAYVISVAGKIGGASGKSVDVGDVYVASADNVGGTEASVGTSWFVLEHNLVGALLSSNNLSDVASASTARSNLGLAIGTNVQAYDAQLTDLAGLSVTSANTIVANGSNWIAQKNELNQTVNPTVNEDSGDGYSVGSRWINTTDDREFVCLDASVGAAVWKQTNFRVTDFPIGPGSFGVNDYIVIYSDSQGEDCYIDGASFASGFVRGSGYGSSGATYTLVGGSGNTVPVYSTNNGYYEYHANWVYFDYYSSGDGGAEGAGTGQLTLTLPYVNTGNTMGGLFPVGTAINGTDKYILFGELAVGSDKMSLYYQTVISSSSTLTLGWSSFTGADQNNATRSIRLKFHMISEL